MRSPVYLCTGESRDSAATIRRLYWRRVVVADELGLPFCEDMLVRRKYTTPQKKLDNLERANNIKTSMDIGRVYPEYRNILLVDDIYTTGVTIDVCAGLLKKAGARHVYYSSVCVGKGC